MKKFNLVKFIASIVICEGAGVLGSIFTAPAIKTWYASLNKPGINPPSWVFAPVWTTLFLLMGIALYLVWTDEKKTKLAIKLFALQLGLNILWSLLFFGLHQPGIAFFELLMLWVAIIYTIINFYRISKPAAYLLLPYILWVSLAGVLNYFLWILNI